mmetsp:Transcript_17588/g.52092  ORF Transcript_17588/g.52092 Transcript_17588/m.52092 type:complete len:217 (+) Transcript_17588:613-1263(+)
MPVAVRFTPHRIIKQRDHPKRVSSTLSACHVERGDARATMALYARPAGSVGCNLFALVQAASWIAQFALELPARFRNGLHSNHQIQNCCVFERRFRNPQCARCVRPLARVGGLERPAIGGAQAALARGRPHAGSTRGTLPPESKRCGDSVAAWVHRNTAAGALHNLLAIVGVGCRHRLGGIERCGRRWGVRGLRMVVRGGGSVSHIRGDLEKVAPP